MESWRCKLEPGDIPQSTWELDEVSPQSSLAHHRDETPPAGGNRNAKEGIATSKPTAILADDHDAFCAIVMRLLQRDFEVLASARDGVELLAAIETYHPDIVVADISMPFLNGIEVVDQARAAGSLNRLDGASTAVVFLTNYEDQMLVERALRVGGLGYVLKTRTALDLLSAIEAARRGECYVSPPLEKPL